MLGEKFHDIVGKITGTRVIPGDNGPKIEISFQAAGKLLGIDTTELGTYTSVMQPSGVFRGEGAGISMSKDGEAVTWQGFGIGRPTGKGLAASYRYSISYQTASPKLARLNNVVGVGEWETDEDGNAKGQSWEWK